MLCRCSDLGLVTEPTSVYSLRRQDDRPEGSSRIRASGAAYAGSVDHDIRVE